MIRSAALLGGLLLALTLGGCAGSGTGEATSTPTPPVSPTAGPSSPLPTPTPAPTGPPAGSGSPVSLTVHQGTPPAGTRIGPAWTVRSAAPARSSVDIAWFGIASPGCGAVRDVWVAETATTVTIDLVRAPRRPAIMCAAVLVPRHAVVPLGAPLGDRRLTEHPPVAVALPRASCPPTSRASKPAIDCPLAR